MAIEAISLKQIRAALEAAGDPWQAGVTSLSVLPREERSKRLGAVPPSGTPSVYEIAERARANKAALAAAARSAVGVPAAYDLRNVGGNNFVTPIKDQGACGSCVAFGTTATVESTLRLQRGDPNLNVDLSEAHLFFCHARARGYGCSTGWWPNEAFDDMRDKGIVDEACYPYVAQDQDCSPCGDWQSRLLFINGSQELTNNPPGIKEWVSTRGPVSSCFVVYDDFFYYTSGIYQHTSGGEAGGHCVTIVGYDDNPGFWICKNSWGTGWGEGGFFRIAYGECGIDSWLNHGVTGIQNTGWQSNRRVLGLWTIDEDRNGWAYFEGLGWRKISPDSDNIFFDMLAQLVAAKASGALVTFYEEQSVIKQIYVF
jgi:C1A family cysteine protease